MMSKNKRRVSPLGGGSAIPDNIMAIMKYANHAPKFDWDVPNNLGGKSGLTMHWKHIHKNPKINICFRNEIEINRLSIMFEYPVNFTQSSLSYLSTVISSEFVDFIEDKIIGVGFFFVENRTTGEIDMYYCIKYLDGSEKHVLYRSVRYFGLDVDIISGYGGQHNIYNKILIYNYKKMSCFTVSNEWQDKTIYVALDLYDKKYSDFKYVVEYVNDFIQNNLKVKHIIETPIAYPLLLGYKQCHRYVMFQETEAESRFPEDNLVLNVDAVKIDKNNDDHDDENSCSHIDTPILNAVLI